MKDGNGSTFNIKVLRFGVRVFCPYNNFWRAFFTPTVIYWRRMWLTN